MKLFILVLIVLVHYGVADLFKKCFNVYGVGSSKPKTIANHCSTIKNTSDCLGAKPCESSPILDYMRFYILQHAMFDIQVGLCSRYDYSQLKNIVTNTDLYKKFGHIFVEKCSSDGKNETLCAKLVHLASAKYYKDKNISTPKQLLCDDARDLSKFYKEVAQKMKCKSEALRCFSSTIRHVVPELNSLILKRFDISCPMS